MRRERDTIFLCWLLLHRGERETQSSYVDCFYIVKSQPNQRAAPVAHKFVWPRPALKSTFFFRGRNSTHCFCSNPQILCPRSRCVTSLTSSGHNSIWDFYFDISEWHILSAHAWTPALMLHRTNPCTKWNVLILTKPKGKIYKTKSLRHYITHLHNYFHNVLADMSSGLLQVFVELGKLNGTSNYVFYRIHGGHLFWFR